MKDKYKPTKMILKRNGGQRRKASIGSALYKKEKRLLLREKRELAHRMGHVDMSWSKFINLKLRLP